MRSLAIILLLAGCTSNESGEAWRGSIETLPNSAARIVNPAEGVWREGQGWTLVPELVLGEAEGPAAEIFGSISGLAIGQNGRIYVLDRQANELRIFTADGRFLGASGRSGEGPGEYTAANGLRWMTPDTLVVIDQQGARYSLLDSDGNYGRSVVRQLPFYGWAFRGGLHGGRIYENFSLGRGDNARPALLGTPLVPGGPIPATAARVPDQQTSATDTILLPTTSVPRYESYSVRTSRGGMMMGVPFAPAVVYHLTDDGRVWHGHGGEFRLTESTVAGDTLREILLEATGIAVTQAEVAEWEAGEGVRRFREMGGKLDLSRVPTTKPVLTDLLESDAGDLWVSIPAGPKEVVFAVFDGEGRFLGRMWADGMERDATVPAIVRNDRLYFVGQDELDVQRVYVFRIARAANPSRNAE